jgi:hypothetical protein
MNFRTSNDGLRRFFAEPEDYSGKFLQFLRIACAIFIASELFAILPDFDILFGKKGPIPHDLIDFIAQRQSVSYVDIIRVGESAGLSERATSIAYLSFFGLSLLMLGLGLFTRAASIATLFCYVALTAGPYRYGVDLFVIIALFYLCVFPAGRTDSLDKRLWRKETPNFTPYLRFFQINVCMIYFFAGLSKSLSVTWYNGDAVWKSLNLAGSNHLFHIRFDFLAGNPWLLSALGISILVIETLYPVAIWIRKWHINRIWLWSTIAMHLGIGIVLNLYFFAAFMIILNLSAFYFSFAEERSVKKVPAI